ncbi:GGDEF domain-containing protein [Massilia sp. 9I]|uniref:GGDEF domain-containing protein n=1 Tax=Massilia sp. 9I TaxID=2653152 RepID=UPI0012F4400A|nr:GGDEF domain-containing protein [Massilia sp. 9I]VXB98648.1 putative Diguanylate cyclase [Massilia sp. 9I]
MHMREGRGERFAGAPALGAEPVTAPPDERLPVLGPAFSACVLILGIWDLVANGSQTPSSLLLRLALVLLGIPGYAWPGGAASTLGRWLLVFTTHSLALVVNAVSLAHGLTEAMPVLVISVLVAGLAESRPRRCIAILLPSALFHAIAGALVLPQLVWLASVAASAVAVAMAMLIAAANGSIREAAWRHEQQLLHACRYDSLSGAMSRAYLTELARRDVSLARRHARPLAVAMIDIDHFKRVNDTHGHATGDAVIRSLVDTCRASLRQDDYVGRIGGEEFVCILPETGVDEAFACAERIRTNVEASLLAAAGGPVRFTVSIGVAVLCGHDGWDALLRDADEAMYRAKAGGRNRTTVASDARCDACA